MAISDQITRLKNAKESIKTSIANKGTTIPESTTLDHYSEYIDQIQTGGNYQSKTVTPTANGQTVLPDVGYDALSSVAVNGDSNLTAENIKKDVKIFGVTGTLEPGGNYQEKTITPTANGQTILPDAGYDALSSVNVYGDQDLIPNNIKEGVSIFGVEGAYSGGGYDLNLIGYGLDIEAGSSITKGQRIVATKNTSATSKTVATSSSGANLGSLSLDQSVGFLSGTTLADGALITAYGVNELGTYEPVASGTVSGVDEAKAKYSNPYVFSGNSITSQYIADDGSYVMCGVNGNFNSFKGGTLIIGEISKSTGTISFNSIDISGITFEDYSTSAYTGAKLDSITSACICDGLIFMFGASQPISASTGGVTILNHPIASLIIGEIKSSGIVITCKRAFETSSSWSINEVRKRDNGNYLIRYNTNNLVLATKNEVLQVYSAGSFAKLGALSKNGKYIGTTGSTSAIRIINDDLSLKTICSTSSNFTSYPSDDGAYFISANGIYSATAPNTRIGIVNDPTCGALSTPNRVVGGKTIYALVPSTEAEYTAIQPRFIYNRKRQNIWNSK